jgi:hypothetical protein
VVYTGILEIILGSLLFSLAIDINVYHAMKRDLKREGYRLKASKDKTSLTEIILLLMVVIVPGLNIAFALRMASEFLKNKWEIYEFLRIQGNIEEDLEIIHNDKDKVLSILTLEDNIKKIALNSKTLDVIVEGHDIPQPLLVERDHNQVCVMDDDEVIITSDYMGIKSSAHKTTRLLLCKDDEYELKIKTTSGAITLSNLYNATLDVETIKGNIIINDVNTEKVTINSLYGNIEVNIPEPQSTTYLNDKIEYLKAFKKSLKIRTVSGDTAVKVLEKKNHYD